MKKVLFFGVAVFVLTNLSIARAQEPSPPPLISIVPIVAQSVEATAPQPEVKFDRFFVPAAWGDFRIQEVNFIRQDKVLVTLVFKDKIANYSLEKNAGGERDTLLSLIEIKQK